MRALKTTVYRTSEESPIVPALVRAAERGKQSVCLVELKARFDEQNNIEGPHARAGRRPRRLRLPRPEDPREDDARRPPRGRPPAALRPHRHRQLPLGHGALYEDVGIFTADEEIAADVADLFNYVTGFGRPKKFRKLLVAPLTLKPRLIALIRAVAAAAQAGKRAEIKLKVNALTDPGIIEEL